MKSIKKICVLGCEESQEWSNKITREGREYCDISFVNDGYYYYITDFLGSQNFVWVCNCDSTHPINYELVSWQDFKDYYEPEEIFITELPENWCIKGGSNVSSWALEEFQEKQNSNYSMDDSGYYFLTGEESEVYNYCFDYEDEIPDDYTLISWEEFEKLFLNKTPHYELY